MLSETAKKAFIDRAMTYVSRELDLLGTTPDEKAALASALVKAISDEHVTNTKPKLLLKLSITGLGCGSNTYQSKYQADAAKLTCEYERVTAPRPEMITPTAQALRPPPPGKGHPAPNRTPDIDSKEPEHRRRLRRTPSFG